MRVAIRCLMVMSLLFAVTVVAAPTASLHKRGQASVLKFIKSFSKNVTKAALLGGLTAALWSGTPAVAQAQHEVLEDAEIQWLDVAEAHHSSTIALQSIPADDKKPQIKTLAYIGDTDRGDAVLVGLTLLPLGGFDTEVSYTAYGTDGMLADNVRIEEIASFDIDFEGFSETTVLVAKGLSLAGLYEPLRFADFPLDDVGGELTMTTYWRGKDEEALPFPTTRLRHCNIGPQNPGWGKFGVGLSTCSPTSAYGSVIFYGETVVGFHGGGGKELIFVEGISDGLKRYLRKLRGEDILPVNADGKVSTTWGALKQR